MTERFKGHSIASNTLVRISGAGRCERPSPGRVGGFCIAGNGGIWAAGFPPWGRRWLLGSRPCLAICSLLPFVRQFRLADTGRLLYNRRPGLWAPQHCSSGFLASRSFLGGDGPARSPRFLLTTWPLAAEWDEAGRRGVSPLDPAGQKPGAGGIHPLPAWLQAGRHPYPAFPTPMPGGGCSPLTRNRLRLP